MVGVTVMLTPLAGNPSRNTGEPAGHSSLTASGSMAAVTGSLKFSVIDVVAVGTPVAPLMGAVLVMVGGTSSGLPVTEMSSTPTHSSLPVALVVMMRICTNAWLLAVAGRVTEIGVTRVAWLGPVVASAT